MRRQFEITLEKVDGLLIGVHLHRDHGAVAHFIRVAVIEDEQPVDGRSGAKEVVLRELCVFQMSELARQHFPR